MEIAKQFFLIFRFFYFRMNGPSSSPVMTFLFSFIFFFFYFKIFYFFVFFFFVYFFFWVVSLFGLVCFGLYLGWFGMGVRVSEMEGWVVQNFYE